MKNTLLVTALFFSTASAFASVNMSTDMPYDKMLQELQTRVGVSFSASMPFLKKATAVQQLHSLVFDPNYQTYFARDGVVQSVGVILEAPSSGNPTPNSNRALLREHTLLFTCDGSDTALLKRELPKFAGELAQIDAALARIQSKVPQFALDRRSSFGMPYSSTNRDLLRTLDLFEKTVFQPRFSSRLSVFGKIHLIDSNDTFKTTQLSRSPYQTLESGKIVTREALTLEVGHEGLYVEDAIITQTQLEQLFSVVLTHGFDSLRFTLLSEIDAQTVLSEFIRFLTPARIQKLTSAGIKHFEFSERFDREEELKKGNTLILGLTTEQMVQVYELLFN